jgi:hypothetical protein
MSKLKHPVREQRKVSPGSPVNYGSSGDEEVIEEEGSSLRKHKSIRRATKPPLPKPDNVAVA